MSVDLRKTLIHAHTGKAELDELAHCVGEQLPVDYNATDIATDIATIACKTLVGLKHYKNQPNMQALTAYLAQGGNPLQLGAQLVDVFQQDAPGFAQEYAATSKLFFGV